MTDRRHRGGLVNHGEQVSAEEVAKLSALGYLTAQSESGSGPLPNPRQEIGNLAEIAKATQLAREGRLAESTAVCRRVLASHPGLLDARLQLAWNLAQQGALEESRREYREAARRSPPHLSVVALDLARLELQAGNPAAAEEQAVQRRLGCAQRLPADLVEQEPVERAGL